MIKQATNDAINEAALLLHAGELVAFPTETVFGLGADATSDTAVAKLYDVKKRPRDKAFSIMVRDIEQAKQLAVLDDRAMTLAQIYWPGPLSMVLPIRENSGLSDVALAGNQTISLRMPKHHVALQLLRACDVPLAVPSANSSGHLSATTAGDVARDLGDNAAIILADATLVIGIESTIIDLTKTPAVILRIGAISRDEIASLIGDVVMADTNEPSAITLKTKLRMNAVDVRAGEAFLGFGNVNYIGVQDIGFVKEMPEHLWRNLSAQGDMHEAAANLYSMLQALDESGAESIAVMNIPETGLGTAINDRLRRAAGRTE
jgi:L-threonylcarbamoyladenylate synthase